MGAAPAALDLPRGACVWSYKNSLSDGFESAGEQGEAYNENKKSVYTTRQRGCVQLMEYPRDFPTPEEYVTHPALCVPFLD